VGKVKIAAIIQARMGSTRLPGKVMEEIAGKPMLRHIIDRLKRAELIHSIVVATTATEIDKPIVMLADDSGTGSYAGSENDVLDRYYRAAKEFAVDAIVRITADCPLIDPRVMDRVVQRYLAGDCDYAANVLKRTYPDGMDVEVFSFAALERAWKESRLASEREHVTPYIKKNPEKFRLANVENNVDLSYLRWSVDENQDLEFVRQVYKHLYKEGNMFYMEDVLELLEKYPDLKQINQGIVINEGYAKSVKEDKIVK
jgi:spore coat polysaccharide biosynthesis protein SpsF (cytidylyltransferase family)